MLDGTFLIVGGGIAGFDSHCCSAAMRHRCTSYKRFSEVRAAGAGLLLAPNALKALEHLGLAQIVQEQGNTSPSGVAILNEQGTVLSGLSANGQGYSNFRKLFVDIRQGEGRVTAIFADRSTATGDYLLAADEVLPSNRLSVHLNCYGVEGQQLSQSGL